MQEDQDARQKLRKADQVTTPVVLDESAPPEIDFQGTVYKFDVL